MDSIICCIAKNENRYLYEWAEYHLSLGFSHLYIYDNNDCDGESISDLFQDSPISDSISVLDVRGKKCMQLEVYDHCFSSFSFDWCAFIDIDEFITFSEGSGIHSINQFLSDKSEFDVVVLNWMCYGDNGHVYYKEDPVLKRFPKPILPITFVASLYDGKPENSHVKSIVNKRANVNWKEERFPSPNPHIPGGVKTVCNALGYSLNDAHPWQSINFEVAYIRHYITKSLEEYSIRINRGTADTASKMRYSVSRFFRYNSISLAKLIACYRIYGSLPLLSILQEKFKWYSIAHGLVFAKLFKSVRRH